MKGNVEIVNDEIIDSQHFMDVKERIGIRIAKVRNHRGLSVERRIKAVYWWCYMHSPEPLSLSEIINVMPTDKSIAAIYQKMNEKNKLEKSLSSWGDAIVWSDLHNYEY